MKKYILILLSVLSIGAFSQVQDTAFVNSKITKVSVFFSGAEVTREINYKAEKGSQLLFIDQLPLGLNVQSIQVSEVKNGKILSVKHENGFKKIKTDPIAFQKMEDRMDMILQEMKTNRSKKSVFVLEQEFILKNGKLGGSKGASIEEIKSGADFYRLKLNEIKTSQLALDIELDQLKEELKELSKKMDAIKLEKRKECGQLYIFLDHNQSQVNATLKFSYYLEGAGWEPIYDFRVKEKGEPLLIDYKAKIYQSSGEDWEAVNLTLSTGNPTLSNAKPELETWYIDKRKKNKNYSVIAGGSGQATIKGVLMDKDCHEPISFANIVLEIGDITIGGTSSDFDGNYIIKPIPPGTYDLKATSVGYQPHMIRGVVIQAGKIHFQDVYMNPSEIALSEVEVVDYKVPLITRDRTTSGATVTSEEIAKMPNRSYGANPTAVGGVYSGSAYEQYGGVNKMGGYGSSGSGGGSYNYQQERVINTNYLIDDVEKKLSNIEYEIKSPFTVLSDGKDYTLKIKEAKVPVSMVYYSIPKMEEDVFLTAQVPDWNQLDLLTGLSSIYYQGSFTGETFIDDSFNGDTLDISLGRDREILVSRKGNKEKMERKTFGKSIRETLSWDIEIKNNKSVPIHLILEDQFPLAEDQSIEIELIELSGAKVNDKTGKLIWDLELEPGAKKSLNVTYSVKYPSYKTLYMN